MHQKPIQVNSNAGDRAGRRRSGVQELADPRLMNKSWGKSAKTSRSRIKRLRAAPPATIPAPVGEVRVFFDMSGMTVEILAIVTRSGAEAWLGAIRRSGVRRVPLCEVEHDLPRFLREAETEEIVITVAEPARVLIGFASEDDGYRLPPRNPAALPVPHRAGPKKSLREERGVKIERM